MIATAIILISAAIRPIANPQRYLLTIATKTTPLSRVIEQVLHLQRRAPVRTPTQMVMGPIARLATAVIPCKVAMDRIVSSHQRPRTTTPSETTIQVRRPKRLPPNDRKAIPILRAQLTSDSSRRGPLSHI